MLVAPEDMKTGDRIRRRIDEAIRIHKQVPMVLTEGSMKSSRVQKEVDPSFNKLKRGLAPANSEKREDVRAEDRRDRRRK